MTNLYTENSEKWQALSGIDYFTQFVKAWIPLNAWYKNYYPLLRNDREAIEEIKTNSNRFKNKLERLIEGDDNDSLLMKNNISNLHYQLERHSICNRNNRISFVNIVIEQNPHNHEEFSYYSWKYEVTRDSNNFKMIESKITDGNGNNKVLINQTNGFNIEEIKNNSQYQSINRGQKDNLISCYKEIDPNKPICLTSNDTDALEIGNYTFINDIDTICKGIVTILYMLRNSLFHGEIIPDKETNKVYEPAYNILHRLVKEL